MADCVTQLQAVDLGPSEEITARQPDLPIPRSPVSTTPYDSGDSRCLRLRDRSSASPTMTMFADRMDRQQRPGPQPRCAPPPLLSNPPTFASFATTSGRDGPPPLHLRTMHTTGRRQFVGAKGASYQAFLRLSSRFAQDLAA